MRRKRFSVLAALTAFLTIISGVFVTQTAGATSAYDSDYTTVDSLFYGEINYYGINCPPTGCIK